MGFDEKLYIQSGCWFAPIQCSLSVIFILIVLSTLYECEYSFVDMDYKVVANISKILSLYSFCLSMYIQGTLKVNSKSFIRAKIFRFLILVFFILFPPSFFVLLSSSGFSFSNFKHKFLFFGYLHLHKKPLKHK